MITIELAQSFKKAYKKRIQNNSKLILQTSKRIELFKSNQKHPILRNHALTGTRFGLCDFSITGDIRIIYYIDKDTAYFIDIGTHNQIY